MGSDIGVKYHNIMLKQCAISFVDIFLIKNIIIFTNRIVLATSF